MISEKQWSQKKVMAEYTTQRVDIKRRLNKWLLGGQKDKKEWSSIMADVQQYNSRALANYDKYQNPLITDEWLESAIRSYYTPSVLER